MSRVVLVTGCSSGGIGYSLQVLFGTYSYSCERFAAEGCRVYATARRLEAMDGLSAHPLIKLQTLDVTSDADVRRVVDLIIADAGQIDIVVNNAGVMGLGASWVSEQPMDNVQATFNANTYGVLRVAQAAFPHMATRRTGPHSKYRLRCRRHVRPLSISSVNIQISAPLRSAVPWNGLYSATKAAVHSMSDILSMELKPFNLRVMNVVPGAIRSNIANNQAARFRSAQLPAFLLPIYIWIHAACRRASLYQDFLPNIIQRMNSSQGPNAMPADAFAKEVVRRALQRNPPANMTLGGNSGMFTLFRWLPKAWVLVVPLAVVFAEDVGRS
ncbi:oxidoreductase [Mycena vulgaris]|nr:oxidoreductase [Mycena vulgaris]